MTKIKSILAISLVLILMAFPILTVSAQTTEEIISTEIVWLNDNDSIEYQLIKINSLFRGTTQAYSKKLIKRMDGVQQCALVVTGKFDINYGTSVRCIESNYSAEIYKSGWSVENMASSYSNSNSSSASATATGKFVKRFLGIPTHTELATATITCDKNGNVS